MKRILTEGEEGNDRIGRRQVTVFVRQEFFIDRFFSLL